MTSGASLAAPPLRGLRWCLALSFAAMGLAVAWRSLNYEDSVFSYLFMTCRWSEADALAVTRAAAWLTAVSSVALLWRRAWPALVVVGGWVAVISVFDMAQHPPDRWLIPGERAVRIVGPLALAVLVALPLRGSVPGYRERWSIGALRLAACATFVFHGVAALLHQPAFLDYIFAAGHRLLGIEIAQETAESMLSVIGVVDLLVGPAILLGSGRVRLVAAGYMAAWGLITCASRVVHSGADGLSEALIRVPNCGVPLALVVYWVWSERRRRAASA